jgi:hypothetical protein
VKFILFLVGLYFGVAFVFDLINYKNLFLDIQAGSVDSTVVLHLALMLLGFLVSYKYKKV